ncbi:Leucine zipper transcription factor-like protein 1-like 2 [Homarus americanus]|nr:Leucine zipper transcription factor-like protein 1-like 2 [Homarus americanus]
MAGTSASPSIKKLKGSAPSSLLPGCQGYQMSSRRRWKRTDPHYAHQLPLLNFAQAQKWHQSQRRHLRPGEPLVDEVENMRLQLTTQAEIKNASQDQLAIDPNASRQTLLQELEKKFTDGAYQNMKKMLNKKNEQIKVMRKKLVAYEPDNGEVIED